MGAFFFWNRTRREIALSPYRILRQTRVYSPYLDHDVFDLLESLPASFFLSHDFYRVAIARAFPRFKEIPYAAKRTRSSSAKSLRRFAVDLVGYAVEKGPSAFIRRGSLMSRALRSLFDPTYPFWPGEPCLYLLQWSAQVQRFQFAVTRRAA